MIIDIKLSFPIEAYFKYGWQPEANLEDALSENYEENSVYLDRTGAVLAKCFGRRDWHIVLEESAEWDDPKEKKALVKEVIAVVTKSMRSSMKLRNKDIKVEVFGA